MRTTTRPASTSSPSGHSALPPPGNSRGLAARVRRLERRFGLYRPGRSPWVWILGPGINLLGTTAIIL
ncbi:MAG: hypothetical protein E6J14_01565 [Chloroflexi bacterium]|nr:MAG: hypothetical protein E6J14_01565 [Chloroflexota bacterium]